VDYIAYTVYAGYVSLANRMMEIAQKRIGMYRVINFKPIATNQFCLPDGLRSTDMTIRQEIETILLNLYEELGVDICMDGGK
jgi:ABC-type antimicrobial peptide transport system ATPase subunit